MKMQVVNGFSLILLSCFFTGMVEPTLKPATKKMNNNPAKTYLALGDSYTIGENVLQADNFPHQLVSLLNSEGSAVAPPLIIAKTGWTTDELDEGITVARENDLLLPHYDMVTLLIGVNNQYRGRSQDEYRLQFEALLKKAIVFAGNRPERVVVISIPDWGITPFANGRDQGQISSEIDAFNSINKKIALQYQAHYINITPLTREASGDPTLLAADGLHPSGKEYKRWAGQLATYFLSKI